MALARSARSVPNACSIAHSRSDRAGIDGCNAFADGPVVQRAFDGRQALVDRRKIGVARATTGAPSRIRAQPGARRTRVRFRRGARKCAARWLARPLGHGVSAATLAGIERALRHRAVEQMAGATVRRGTRRAGRRPRSRASRRGKWRTISSAPGRSPPMSPSTCTMSSTLAARPACEAREAARRSTSSSSGERRGLAPPSRVRSAASRRRW